MFLLSARVSGFGPFDDLVFPFGNEEAHPRKASVLFGGGGVGKTSLLLAICSTRPGFSAPLPKSRKRPGPFAQCAWQLGMDDPARPHALRIMSPNAPTEEREDEVLLRRREQALFERRAQEGGFAFFAFPSIRWFSRSPVLLAGYDRALARYDVRHVPSFEDPSRADLSRETKLALTYSFVGRALFREVPMTEELVSETPLGMRGEMFERTRRFCQALPEAVEPLCRIAGFRFVGADPASLEPLFAPLAHGAPVVFDELPTSVKHLVSFAALGVRVMHAAHPDRDPREVEGTILIDDVELHQEQRTLRSLVPALREALPSVQWIVTSSSLEVAQGCEPEEILALRRLAATTRVELYAGGGATMH